MTTDRIWIKVKMAEKLGIPLRTLVRKCSAGELIARKVPSPGKTGFTYEVALESLPDRCKKLYLQNNVEIESVCEAPVINPEDEKNLIDTMPDWARGYVNRFLILYEVTKTLRGTDLKFFLSNWCAKNPEYKWDYKSFMRIKLIYESAGKSVTAIMPKWGKLSGRSIVPDDLSKLFDAEYLTQRQPASYSCWKNVLGAAILQNKDLDVSTFPSHMAFLRKTKTKYSESVIFYMRNGLAKWKAKYGYSIGRNYDDILCGEVWVSDHVQSDVMVETPDGKTHFMWCTVWVDVKSRKWLGWFTHLDAPNSDHIFTAFYRAAKRWGIPSDVIVDNGKDYRCKALTGGRVINSWHKVKVDEMQCLSLFCDLKITVHFAWPYNPESKICERTFSTINSGFSRHCYGYRGPNIMERPDTLKAEHNRGDIWSVEKFIEKFDRYVIEGYNLDESKGKTLKGRCPDELFNIEWPRAIKLECVHLVSAAALKMFCSPLSDSRQIRNAVVYDKKLEIKYYAPWMKSANGANVRMRRDQDDYSVAFFWDESGTYLGEASIDGNVSALARTPVQKKELEEKIRIKKDVERSVRTIARSVGKTDNDNFIENRIAGIQALNNARGFTPSEPKITENYLITSMDRVIAETKRQKTTFDYSSDADMETKQSDPMDDIDLWGTKAVNL